MRTGKPLVFVFVMLTLIGCSQKGSAGLGPDGGPGWPPDASVPSELTGLPELTNVQVTPAEDSVGIDFDPVDGAVDYRVYPLPAEGDVANGPDGTLTVRNAVYRCAGTRQTFDVPNNLNQSSNLTTADGTPTVQIDPDPAKNTLGYVYPTAGDGRLPVYALAGDATDYDIEVGWRESRVKIYTTDPSQRQGLLSQGWRDDGIVFYVPAQASSSTQTVYSSQVNEIAAGQGWLHVWQYYFGADQVSAHQGDTIPPAPAFQVLSAPAAGAQPLMASLYSGKQDHTELSAGKERFHRAAYQGNGPLWHLEWSGLTAPTVLVVEALSSGCPYQGFLSPGPIPQTAAHQPFFTLQDLQAASPTGEVFVNGQFDSANRPKAIARSFVVVAPQPHVKSDWDWYQGFTTGSSFGPVTEATCSTWACGHWTTPTFDISAYNIDSSQDGAGQDQFILQFGQFLGQMWVAFDDAGSDVTGKVRFTALQKAAIPTDGSYLHVKMSVDIVTTGRRYPQLILSDQDAPVQDNLSNPNGNTVIIQPIQGPEMRIEMQAFHGLINGNPWDVNNQAPEHRFTDQQSLTISPAADPPFEHAGVDRLAHFDVYLSSQRAYVLMDGQPVGCSLLPSGFSLTGPVTVTFGDVLYHEGATDELVCSQSMPYGFMNQHQCTETKRHFDDLAFKSGVGAPSWDEKRFPCLAY